MHLSKKVTLDQLTTDGLRGVFAWEQIATAKHPLSLEKAMRLETLILG